MAEFVYDSDPGWPGISAGNNLIGRLAGEKYRDENDGSWGYATYSYDARGRIEFIKNLLPGSGSELGLKSIAYEYNSADLVEKIAYNTGSTDAFHIWYEYNEFAEVEDVFASTSNQQPQYPIAHYTYTDLGQVETIELKNESGIVIQTITNNYNNREWLDDISAGSFWQDLDYSGDGAGNIKGVSQQIDTDRDGSLANEDSYGYTFRYDDAYRLTSATKNNSSVGQQKSVGYRYDKNGNITGLFRGSADIPAENYHYNPSSNQLLYLDGQDTQNYQYDANGNLVQDLSKGINTNILYDYRNLPYHIPLPDNHWIKFGYDVNGNRVYKRYTNR